MVHNHFERNGCKLLVNFAVRNADSKGFEEYDFLKRNSWAQKKNFKIKVINYLNVESPDSATSMYQYAHNGFNHSVLQKINNIK